jgi:hypothetical protein
MAKSLPLLVWLLLLFPVSAGTLAVAAHGQQPAAAKAPKPAADTPKPAADDGPPVLPHPHKVYVDQQANKIFWPMDMPFWVRLAASPDPNAPSYLLQRVAPDPDIHSDITTDQYSKNGIELEIRGRQFIRWFNYITKEIVFLEFFSDGDPPVTKATCTGAETASVAGLTFYGRGLQCSLASQDELSGVDTTYVSLGDQAWKPYASALNLDTEGPVVLRYYAVDRVGWAETPGALRFTVDLSPPVTTDAITGNALGNVLSSQAGFSISSTDALSGVATVNARFDHDDFKPVTGGAVTVAGLPDGQHTLSYYSVDRVGNRETERDIPFYVDRLPPQVGAVVVGDQFVAPDGTRYVSSRSRVELDSTDNKSGVAQVNYSLEADNFLPYTVPFSLPPKTGSAKVAYRASDKLGNTSEVATLPYTMDLTPPQSAYQIVGPHYQVRSDIYITSATRISLSSTDDGSGVLHTQYQEEGEAQAHIYSAPLAYPDEGRRLVRFWGTDQVNNREMDRALVLITDNTPPQIFANFSVAKSSTTADGLPVYRRLTSLFLGATDNAAGVQKIYYTFDGGKEMEYSTPLVLDHDGTFDLEIRVDDNLGNESSKHLRFVITG